MPGLVCGSGLKLKLTERWKTDDEVQKGPFKLHV